MPQTVSDLHLEQYALGELSPEQARRVREALDGDPGLRDRLSALKESDRTILSDYPPQRMVPAIKERARQSRPERPRWLTGALWALPAAAVLMIALSVGVFRPETRVKGIAPHLSVFVQTPSGGQELQPGAGARRGDRIQLSYSAPGAKYAAIFSLDGRGTVTWHLPAGYGGGAGTAPAVVASGRGVLPSAYELDDAPGFERFFLVYGASPFSLADVQKAALALASRPSLADTAALAVPRGTSQVSFLLKKQG